MVCVACGADNRTGIRFCEQCGARLPIACPACGARIPPDRNFCGECGAPLTVVAPAGVAPAACLAGARLALKRRDRPAAERYLAEARAIADALGMRPLASHVDAALRPLA
jgi:predicted nucleic acid-binding Zn ribbon protein